MELLSTYLPCFKGKYVDNLKKCERRMMNRPTIPYIQGIVGL
jgi:hypothetical protein